MWKGTFSQDSVPVKNETPPHDSVTWMIFCMTQSHVAVEEFWPTLLYNFAQFFETWRHLFVHSSLEAIAATWFFYFSGILLSCMLLCNIIVWPSFSQALAARQMTSNLTEEYFDMQFMVASLATSKCEFKFNSSPFTHRADGCMNTSAWKSHTCSVFF